MSCGNVISAGERETARNTLLVVVFSFLWRRMLQLMFFFILLLSSVMFDSWSDFIEYYKGHSISDHHSRTPQTCSKITNPGNPLCIFARHSV